MPCCLAVAGAVIVAIVAIQKKNSKKATRVISLVLCGAIAISGIATTGFLSVSAEEDNSRSFTVQTVVTVDGGDYTLEGKVNYTLPENIELIINQKDFETKSNSISLSGTVNANIPINSVQYEVCSEIDNNEASYLGLAILDEKSQSWSIDDLKVKPGNNKVIITAISDEASVNKAINIKYDIGKPYDVNNDNVKYDESKDINYVNNIVLIYFKNDVSTDRIEQIIQDNNGTIAGRADFFYQMQIEERNYSEIEKICEKLMQYDEVLYASPDLASHLTESAIPKDPWERKTDWDESNPSGGNWGLEAIEAISAWDYDKYFSHIDVGVVDSGFDLDHEDLKEVLRPSTDWMESENDYRKVNEYGDTENNSHSTFVSGIIGAIDNNERGTTGVLWDTDIYYTDWSPYTKEQFWDTTARIVSSLIYSVEAGAKIINYSLGNIVDIKYEEFIRDFQGEVASITPNKEVLNYEAGIFSLVMESLLDRDFDFLVVQAAGNGAKVEIEPNKVVNVAVDAKNSSTFCAINEANVLASTDEMKQSILDRIIVVGAAKRNADGRYQQCVFSNGGDRVDLCAPGEDIYGLTVDDKYEKDGWVGTSLAAPYVTGVCGMVWSVNPYLSGADVKDIVCNSTSIMVDDNPDINHPLENTYPMVNAKLSVEEALKSLNSFYGVTGAVLAEDTKEPIANATVSVYDGNTLLGQTQTSESGTYKLTFNSDTTSQYFKLTVDKAGRWPYINSQLELTAGVTTVVENIYMKLWDSGLEPGENPTPDDNFAGGDGSVENPYQIATARQLDAVRNHLDSNFVLINDIDLSEYSNWVPIGGISYDVFGDENKAWEGNIDGQGHTIYNLKMNYTVQGENSDGYRFGLFVGTGGSIQNLNLKHTSIKISANGTNLSIGSIAAGAVASTSNCYAEGEMDISVAQQCFASIGGIAASLTTPSYTVSKSETENVYSNMQITVKTTENSDVDIGGLFAGCGLDLLQNCKNYGNIVVYTNNDYDPDENIDVGYGGVYCSGIVCLAAKEINNCLNFGDIKVIGKNLSSAILLGGIASSSVRDSSKIISCANYGNIDAEIINASDAPYGFKIGGILGDIGYATLDISHVKIEKCVNFGDLALNVDGICEVDVTIGGISGDVPILWNSKTGVHDCYNLSEKIEFTGNNGLDKNICIGRILPIKFGDTSNIYECYSLNSTLLNGLPATEEVGPTKKNGGSMTRAEIEKAVTDLGFELPGQTQYFVWKGIPQTVLST